MERIEQIAVRRGYVVTEEGKLFNPRGEKIGSTVWEGYSGTNLRVDKKHIRLFTHRLQAYQKYGNKLYKEGIQVRHFNGESLNNKWGNILIGTGSDNQMDIPEQIRIKRALTATAHIRKYNKKEVKDFHKISNSYQETMEKFGITSKGTLHYILNN